MSKRTEKFLIKETMMNPSVGWQSTAELSDSPASVSAVVDPSAAVTDPGNPNFKPTNRNELRAAISDMINSISDDCAEEIFDAMKSAIEKTQEDKDMKTDKKVEETIRLAIRKIISEAKPRPKFKDVPVGPVTNPLGITPTRYPAGMAGGEATRKFEKMKAGIHQSLDKTLRDAESAEMMRSDEPAAGRSRKNVMQTDVGGNSFKEIAQEMGYASESGAKQAVERILGTVKFRLSLPEEEVEIVVLTTLKDWIDELERSGASEEELEEVRNDPTLMEDWEEVREHINKRLNKYEKAVDSGESLDDFLYAQAKRVSAHQRKYPEGESVEESFSNKNLKESGEKTNRYIEHLKSSGRITSSDEELMRSYPEIAKSLPGYKAFRG